jgi:hypothetical protein
MATTTPNYGWDVPTSTDYVKDGAVAIETLGDDIDATLWTALGGDYPGLRLVKKQTIGSAVSSVTVTGAFSATYNAYKIIVTGGSCGSQASVTMQLGSTTTGYYEARPNCTFAGVVSANATNNGASFNIGQVYSTGALVNDEVMNPFLATATQHATSLFSGGTSRMDQSFGYLNNSTSYTAFTLGFSEAVTGGTIYVYGYGMS